MGKYNFNGGQSLIEIIVAMAVGGILIGAAVTAMVPILRNNLESKNVQVATSLGQEYLDNLKNLTESNWVKIYNPPAAKGSGSQFYLSATSTTYEILSGTTSTIIEDQTFTRYFSIENVNRDSCGIGDITSDNSSACFSPGDAGITEDPSTQKITVNVSWQSGQRSLNKVGYLTRYRNNSFTQSDWLGGPGQENFPAGQGVSALNDMFSSTPNSSVDYNSLAGSIIIKGLGGVTSTTLSIVQTDDSNSASGFNLTGRSFVDTKIVGTGSSAKVELIPALVPWVNVVVASTTVSESHTNSELRLGSDGLPRIVYTGPDGKLKFLRCLDIICSPGNIIINDIDDTNGTPVGFALASDDTARISYTDDSGYHNIKFAECNDINCVSVNTRQIYNQTITPNHYAGSSLALGADGNARITLNDAGNLNLIFVRCLDTECLSLASTTLGTIYSTYAGSNDIRNQTAMAPDGFARLTFINSNGALRFVQCQNDNCTVNTSSTPWTGTHFSHSLTLDSNVNAMIALRDGYETMQYIHCLNSSCSNSTAKEISDETYDSWYPSIAKDSHGLARIVNGNRDVYSLGFKQCLTAACGPDLITDPPNRTTSTIDAPPGIEVGWHTSLALGAGQYKDRGRVSYYDGTNEKLKYAYQEEIYNSYGTYTSGFINAGNISSWEDIDWTKSSGGTITIKARSANDSSGTGALNWTSCSNITKGADLSTGGCVDNSQSYIQYQVAFHTTDPDVAPALNDLTITFVSSSGSGEPVPSIVQTDASISITGFNLGGATFSETQVTGTGVAAKVALLTTKTLDSNGDVGRNSSLAMGSDGFARIAYLDDTNNKLKYIRCLNISCSSKNTAIIDDAYNSSGKINLSLKLGTDGNARISYLGATGNKFAKCANANCTSVTTKTIQDNAAYYDYVASDMALDSDNNAFIVTNDERQSKGRKIIAIKCSVSDCSIYTSSTLRTNDTPIDRANFSVKIGTDGNPRIVMNTNSVGARFVKCTNPACTTSASSTLGVSYLRESSMFLDSNNYGQIVYYDDGYYTFHYINCTNADCSSFNDNEIQQFSYDGAYPSVAKDSNGRGRISNGVDTLYGGDSTLSFKKCLNTACNSLTPSIIDAPEGVSTGLFTSMGLGTGAYQDLFRISYYDETNGDLKYAYEASSYTGVYTSGFIDSEGTPNWGAISWTQGGGGGAITMKARTSNSPTMAGAPDWNSCSNISNGADLETGDCVTYGERYIQYQATLSTTNYSLIPTLNDVTINLTAAAGAGTLISSVFDTGVSTGVNLNTIMWQGVQAPSTNVQFQIASDSTSTPAIWNYKGPDGTDTAYYFPAGPNIPAQVNSTHHNNHRFFRYKIFMSSPGGTESPRVDDVIINYSQ